ncbi:MAG: hypothetical protein U0K36_07650 [Bacteroidales bacterium]|nr:hypothetical protein [Bacteroidales bacterium]
MGWLDLLLGIGAVAVGAGALIFVCSYISKQEIKKQATERFKELKRTAKHVDKGLRRSCYARVNDKQRSSVGIGLYNSGDEIDSFKIESKNGVDPEVYVGQIIPLEV